MVRARMVGQNPQPEQLITRLDEMAPYSEISLSIQAERDKAVALQWILDDLAKNISSNINPGDLSARLHKLHDLLQSHFSREERVATLDWMEGHLDDAIAGQLQLGGVYHKALGDMSREYGQPASEQKHLEWMSLHLPRTEEAFESRERLTDMYIETWKLPNKAVEMQRAIVSDFKGAEREYQARMKIAKILYEQKLYPETIVELSQLLKQMPAQYSNSAVHTMLGLAYLSNNNLEDARNEFAQVINQDEGEYREKCLYMMGYSFVIEQRYSEAVQPFNDLQKLYPDGSYSRKAGEFLSKIATLKN